MANILERTRVAPQSAGDVEILFPAAITEKDYDFLGRDFEKSKVMMARRSGEVQAVAAFRLLPDAFFVHCLWVLGAEENQYDAEAIAALIYYLRITSVDSGYSGIEFQLMPEMFHVFALLQMHLGASPVAIMGYIPGPKRYGSRDSHLRARSAK